MHVAWQRFKRWILVPWRWQSLTAAAFFSLAFFPASRFFVEWVFGIALFTWVTRAYYVALDTQKMVEVDNLNLRGLYNMYEQLQTNNQELRGFVENILSEFGRDLGEAKDHSELLSLVRENIDLTQTLMTAISNTLVVNMEEMNHEL